MSAAPPTLATRAADQLRRAILEGELAPGTRLGVEALRDSLKMGASPLREALSRLAAEGVVQKFDGRGFRVASADPAEFADLLETRCLTEGAALRAAIARGDAGWEEGVVLAQHRLARTPRAMPDWEARHRAFHLALLAGCGAQGLLAFCAELHDRTTRYRRLAKQAAPRRDIAAEHAGLAQAALARRADAAVAALVAHYRHTAAVLAPTLWPVR